MVYKLGWFLAFSTTSLEVSFLESANSFTALPSAFLLPKQCSCCLLTYSCFRGFTVKTQIYRHLSEVSEKKSWNRHRCSIFYHYWKPFLFLLLLFPIVIPFTADIPLVPKHQGLPSAGFILGHRPLSWAQMTTPSFLLPLELTPVNTDQFLLKLLMMTVTFFAMSLWERLLIFPQYQSLFPCSSKTLLSFGWHIATQRPNSPALLPLVMVMKWSWDQWTNGTWEVTCAIWSSSTWRSHLT